MRSAHADTLAPRPPAGCIYVAGHGISITVECTNDVCGLRRVGEQRRKGREWWNEEVGRAVTEKRRAFEE